MKNLFFKTSQDFLETTASAYLSARSEQTTEPPGGKRSGGSVVFHVTKTGKRTRTERLNGELD